MGRGRPPLGPKLADGIEGSEYARKCLRTILQTVAGEISVTQVCEALGIGEAAFHKMRVKAFEGALAGLEPKPAGRPPKEVSPEQEQIAALQRQLKYMELQLFASQVREEIALAMPHVLKDKKGGLPGKDQKKGD